LKVTGRHSDPRSLSGGRVRLEPLPSQPVPGESLCLLPEANQADRHVYERREKPVQTQRVLRLDAPLIARSHGGLDAGFDVPDLRIESSGQIGSDKCPWVRLPLAARSIDGLSPQSEAGIWKSRY
jgi:hypothetical protein